MVSTFRSANIESLFGAHTKASGWVSKAKKIVIWGYSLGDYDADVNAMLATYTSADVAQLELIVIDPDFRAFQRAIALTGITNALHYNPITKTKVRFMQIDTAGKSCGYSSFPLKFRRIFRWISDTIERRLS